MDKNTFCPTPPMGWNSYDYFDTTVTEQDVIANADVMQRLLKPYGWEYVVVDIQWYARRPNARRQEFQYLPFGELNIDQYARLIPDPERFPSSTDGTGFQWLAEEIHKRGLKFGIHIMRGIPRAAAHARMPIAGTKATADEVADPCSICRWNPDMYGVRNTAAGYQYYRSLIELYAGWGVDFIKCDDICNTDNWIEGSTRAYEGAHEIEMLHRAIEDCGRPIVLSLSPGPALPGKADHYAAHANMWRITDDMWDRWDHVKAMFRRCSVWQDKVQPGCWPDCDMLPLGRIGKGFGEERDSSLSQEEQRTLMTLWCIFGSPLMMGGSLPDMDAWTLSLLTNQKVLALLDPARQRRMISLSPDRAIWLSRNPADGRCAVALFNLSEKEQEFSLISQEDQEDWPPALQPVWAPIFHASEWEDLWTGDVCPISRQGSFALPPHGCRLLEMS